MNGRHMLGVFLGVLGCGSNTAGDGGIGDGEGTGVVSVGPTESGEGDGSGATSGASVSGSAEGGASSGQSGTSDDSTTGNATSGDGTSTGSDDATSGADGDGTTTGMGSDDGASSTTMDCPSAEVAYEQVVPTVVILVDRSSSMTNSFDGTTRWAAVRDSLIDPTDGVITALQSSVRFGLSTYTRTNNQPDNVCPFIDAVDPALDNLDPITTLYQDAAPLNGTPTGESVIEVTEALLADPHEGPKIIVLATDGNPDTCENSNSTPEARQLSVDAVTDAYASGIETFVMSVGNGVSADHLQDLANAGVGLQPGDPDAPYYVPADEAAMVATFEDIINGARSCVFTLDGQIVEGQEDRGTVTVNGDPIVYLDPDGWRVNDPSEIELLGEACELIQSGGDVEVVIEFECDAIVPQ